MKVDVNISDLFFNTEHFYSYDGGHTGIKDEANDFLDSLRRLGVEVPTSEDLIQDFFNRV